MRIEKEDSAIQEAAARENVHFVLNGVRVEPGRLVATDGRVLVTREVRKEEGEEDFAPYLLDRSAFKSMKGGSLTAGPNGTATFRGEKGVEMSIPKQEKTYPKWERVLPNLEENPGITIMLSVEYLQKLLKAFKGVEKVNLTIVDGETAATLEGETSDGRKVLGLIMPMTLK